MSRKMLASEIYAISQGRKCAGRFECHWCSAPCDDSMICDDPPPQPFKKASVYAKRPGNQYICMGCWLWRRKKITAKILCDGPEELMDGQSPYKHSWLITENGAWSLKPSSKTPLSRFLLKPTKRFVLSFIRIPSLDNHLQLCEANDLDDIKLDTELVFTTNGNPLKYTIYELREALRFGEQGKSPGVRCLMDLLGVTVPEGEEEKEEKRSRGRPPKDNPLREDLLLSLNPLGKKPVPNQDSERDGQKDPDNL